MDSSNTSPEIKLEISTVDVNKNENENKSDTELKLTSPVEKFKQKYIQNESSSSGSATGNPRNKCALKPGHSLMDWIRLGNSNIDLAGTKGHIIKVSHTELAKHNTRDNAWLAIRGKVYNVTKYMDFHPGGVDELMKGVGKDATKLFDDIHAWVNYEQLLAKCFVGPLKLTGMMTINEEVKTTTSKSTSPNLNDYLKFPSFKFSNSTTVKKSPEKIEIIPRFDWIQKTSNVTLVFYTKSLCNAGLFIKKLKNKDNTFKITIFINNLTYCYSLQFLHNVNWPCYVNNFIESGKFEINFIKSIPKLWTNYGSCDKLKTDIFEIIENEYEVECLNKFNHDSYSLVLNSKDELVQIVPIGYHFSITAFIDGEKVVRSYTPVPLNFLNNDNSIDDNKLGLIIKSYNKGLLSKYLIKDNPKVSSLFLSESKGNFSLLKIQNHNRIGLIAAGSGITPMLGILNYLLDRKNNKIEQILFVLFNKTKSDIWCYDKLNKITENDKRLKVRHILSEEDWNGETGRISDSVILSLTEKDSSDYITYACVCGPSMFNELTVKLFENANFTMENLHCFQG